MHIRLRNYPRLCNKISLELRVYLVMRRVRLNVLVQGYVFKVFVHASEDHVEIELVLCHVQNDNVFPGRAHQYLPIMCVDVSQTRVSIAEFGAFRQPTR